MAHSFSSFVAVLVFLVNMSTLFSFQYVKLIIYYYLMAAFNEVTRSCFIMFNPFSSLKRQLHWLFWFCYLFAYYETVAVRIYNLTVILNLNTVLSELFIIFDFKNGIEYIIIKSTKNTNPCHPVSYTHLTLPTNREV